VDINSDLGRQGFDKFAMQEVNHLNFLRRAQPWTARFMSKRQCQCKRIRGIGRRRLGQLQHALNHARHSGLLRGTVTNNRLFDFPRRDFVNGDARFRNGRERRAARFAHDQGRLQILRIEQPFDHARLRLMLLQHRADASGNVRQAAGAFPTSRAREGPVRDKGGGILPKPNDSVTRPAQRRVDAKHSIKRNAQLRRGHSRRRLAAAAGKALLQLFKLFCGNGHELNLRRCARGGAFVAREVIFHV
jgi:hypothetical protein